MKKSLFLFLIVALNFVLCPVTLADEQIIISNQQDKILNGSEIQVLISEKSMKGVTTKGFFVIYHFEKSGHIFANSSFGSDTGRWSLKDGQLCLEFTKWNNACPTQVFIRDGVIHFGEWFTQQN